MKRTQSTLGQATTVDSCGNGDHAFLRGYHAQPQNLKPQNQILMVSHPSPIEIGNWGFGIFPVSDKPTPLFHLLIGG